MFWVLKRTVSFEHPQLVLKLMDKEIYVLCQKFLPILTYNMDEN